MLPPAREPAVWIEKPALMPTSPLALLNPDALGFIAMKNKVEAVGVIMVEPSGAV